MRSSSRSMQPAVAVLVAGGLVLGAAALARRWSPEPARPETENWYAILEKPPYAPPGAVIGAAWATLDGLLILAGARLLAAPHSAARCRALAGWGIAVAGIPAWTATFFGARCIPGGLAIIGAMLGGTVGAVKAAGRFDRIASRALVPLAGWLGFAGLLNFEMWIRNR